MGKTRHLALRRYLLPEPILATALLQTALPLTARDAGQEVQPLDQAVTLAMGLRPREVIVDQRMSGGTIEADTTYEDTTDGDDICFSPTNFYPRHCTANRGCRLSKEMQKGKTVRQRLHF